MFLQYNLRLTSTALPLTMITQTIMGGYRGFSVGLLQSGIVY